LDTWLIGATRATPPPPRFTQAGDTTRPRGPSCRFGCCLCTLVCSPREDCEQAYTNNIKIDLGSVTLASHFHFTAWLHQSVTTAVLPPLHAFAWGTTAKKEEKDEWHHRLGSRHSSLSYHLSRLSNSGFMIHAYVTARPDFCTLLIYMSLVVPGPGGTPAQCGARCLSPQTNKRNQQ